LSPIQRRMLRGRARRGQPSRPAPSRKRCVILPEGVLVIRLDVQDALGLGEVRVHRAAAPCRGSRGRFPWVRSRSGSAPRHAAVDDRRYADDFPSAKMMGGRPMKIIGRGRRRR
jgi:hypothetical protein